MGSVFSPRYFAARRRAVGHAAMDHCGINAVLYHRRHGRWVMTQVPQHAVQRSPAALRISGSQLCVDASRVMIDLNERTAPWGRPLRGRVELELRGGLPAPRALDRLRDHGWWPVGAEATAKVQLDEPHVSFSGSAYHDCNFGRVPLEASFSRWTWSRANLQRGVALLYDTVERDGSAHEVGLLIAQDKVEPVLAPHTAALGRGLWGVRDQTRSDRAEPPPRILRRLEDTPFYNRSLLETSLAGERCVAVHESLDLERFTQPWVQFLLPFRIRRRSG